MHDPMRAGHVLVVSFSTFIAFDPIAVGFADVFQERNSVEVGPLDSEAHMEHIRQAQFRSPLPEAEELPAVPNANFGYVLEERLQFDEIVVAVGLVEDHLKALVAEIDVAEEQRRLQEPFAHRHEGILDQADPLRPTPSCALTLHSAASTGAAQRMRARAIVGCLRIWR